MLGRSGMKDANSLVLSHWPRRLSGLGFPAECDSVTELNVC